MKLPKIVLEFVPVRGGSPREDEAVVMPTNSWVKGMAAILYTSLAIDTSSATDIDGNAVTVGTDSTKRMDATASAGGINGGIVLGTGTTAVDRDDNSVETEIADGAGSGQLEYQSQNFSSLRTITGGYEVVLTRQVDNLSGADVDIKEAGVYVTTSMSTGTDQLCILRDRISPAYTLGDGESVVVKYRLQWTA